MCGLVGVASKSVILDIGWLSSARDAMKHRGPDDYGELWSSDRKVGLGHRRLSILDLTPLGHQPMQVEELGLHIVFNGEIYNHEELRRELVGLGFAFRSHSDTEVLLAAYATWGERCVSRLNGMFAFAIYDSAKKLLFLGRDRAGEKPLFYRLSHGVLQFASELKALMANPANDLRISAGALDAYLALGYIPGGSCILQGFNKLPPAHLLRFDLRSGEAQVSRYWHPPEFIEEKSSFSEVYLLDELENLLEDATRKQMVADVPVGVLLSGGVDSSLVTALAARGSSRLQTFTIGFPGHGEIDETEHAQLIARHFGTRHTGLMAEDATAELLPSLARQFDEPMVDSSMIPTFLVSHLVRQHCTVALGGDGGDELFGGYPHYSRLLWMQQKLGWVPHSLRKSVSVLAGNCFPIGYKGRNWAQGLAADLSNGLPLTTSCFDVATRRNLMRDRAYLPLSAEMMRLEMLPVNSDMLQRATRMDFANYLAEDILVKVDRASMMNSLEMRAPFLDYRVIEFAFGKVPSRLKATTKEKKILLKRLAARVLPSGFDSQRKQGFSIPLKKWLQDGPFRNLFNEVLRDPACAFDVKAIDRLFSGQARGRNNGERLFALVLFELWRREYNVSF